jgi:hypothetical protein
MPRRIDYFISNRRHHWQVVSRVSRIMAERGHDGRVLSLCEVRGEITPPAVTDEVPVVPVIGKVASVGRRGVVKSSRNGRARRILRKAAWYGRLAPKLEWQLRRRRPDIVVLPNDLAYPFDRIVDMLDRLGIRWVLYQEGILFPLPPSDLRPYGAGGADAIAAWGTDAADYFTGNAGAPSHTVHAVGSPRHDDFSREAFEADAERLRHEVPDGFKLITFFGTTVDKPGGHCSSAEKLESIQQFVDSLVPLMETHPFKLWVKPHAGENAQEYQDILQRSAIAEHAELRTDLLTFPAVLASDAVIMNGSSIGVEALLLGARVGCIPVPRTGYPFDYGTSKAYVQIPATDGADAIRELLTTSADEEIVTANLEKHFANRPHAAEAMATMLETM